MITRSCFLTLAVVAICLASVPIAAAADTVVPNNQIVQGFQCIGVTCADGEAMSGPTIMSKSTDTPGIRLFQTAGAWPTQTWDIAGNEANFFIRDNTAGSHLPFRIRPGAPTSSIDIAADGQISTAGIMQQNVTVTATDAVNGPDVLAALRGIDVSHYTAAGAVHATPSGADFRTVFGLGASNAFLAPLDVAAIALAGVKALDARVSAIALTPGQTGSTGPAGAKGDTGATGSTGAAGGGLATADARITALEQANKRLMRLVVAMQHQLRALGGPARAATGRAGAAGGVSGRLSQ